MAVDDRSGREENTINSFFCISYFVGFGFLIIIIIIIPNLKVYMMTFEYPRRRSKISLVEKTKIALPTKLKLILG